MKQIYRFLSFFFIFSSATVVKAAVPVITSSLDSQTYWVNESFNYTITATESPDEYFAAGLEALGGTVTYFSATGLFEGAPSNAGDFDLAIAAENAEGRSERLMTM